MGCADGTIDIDWLLAAWTGLANSSTEARKAGQVSRISLAMFIFLT
ncbi:hypothetical protein B6N60_04259 [Richelia sinica FACHB-800]|uniref:Uncharacterized protein n=1 Tax=Richelia sinica FACHB-800 TaxID=1357546 RepID=A0A975Y6R9_9NOST|nr:hypothetical protein B6N60_04259 [Richelia sinica FACHB-800]